MFDPCFWEVSVERETLEGFRNEDRLWYESREEREVRYRREDRVTGWMEEIKRIIERELTQRQRENVFAVNSTLFRSRFGRICLNRPNRARRNGVHGKAFAVEIKL